ncbi:MAG: diguanylate cyclase, partial [Pseudomonadota bacterium]
MNGHESINIAVLTADQDAVEIVNRTLRNSGLAAHCQWVKSPAALDEHLNGTPPELIVLDCDTYSDTVRQVIKQKDAFLPELSLLAVQQAINEEAILAAMQQGAVDLVSLLNTDRLLAVISRELRAGRIERALNSTLQSATTYRKQLYDYMEGSKRAIAYVQEGIITSVNGAWLKLFEVDGKDEIVGMPLMDNFEIESQAAIKGAIVATTKRKWQTGQKLSAKTRLPNGNVQTLQLDFQLAEFDDGDHVQIRISPAEEQPDEPTKLVHDALKRDPTTLFFHRAQFLERITKRLAKKPGSGLHVLVYIKPDEFSQVADRVGLIASEEVFAQFAEEVRKRLHPRDVAGRFEGTVLMALLERGNERDAEVWAQQLVDHISAATFTVSDHQVDMTCTVGVCAVSGVFENMDELVSAAAQARAQGKQSGGNTVQTCDSPDEDTKQRRHDAVWVERINAAMLEDRFRLAHLPIAGLRSDSFAMFDMLVRMIDEQGKPVLPSEFLPVAERNGIMNIIDRWMIGAALDYCAAEGAD